MKMSGDRCFLLWRASRAIYHSWHSWRGQTEEDKVTEPESWQYGRICGVGAFGDAVTTLELIPCGMASSTIMNGKVWRLNAEPRVLLLTSSLEKKVKRSLVSYQDADRRPIRARGTWSGIWQCTVINDRSHSAEECSKKHNVESAGTSNGFPTRAFIRLLVIPHFTTSFDIMASLWVKGLCLSKFPDTDSNLWELVSLYYGICKLEITIY